MLLFQKVFMSSAPSTVTKRLFSLLVVVSVMTGRYPHVLDQVPVYYQKDWSRQETQVPNKSRKRRKYQLLRARMLVEVYYQSGCDVMHSPFFTTSFYTFVQWKNMYITCLMFLYCTMSFLFLLSSLWQVCREHCIRQLLPNREAQLEQYFF